MINNGDIISLICEFMDDKSKINFTSVSNSFIPFKNKIFYDDIVDYDKIEKIYYLIDLKILELIQ